MMKCAPTSAARSMPSRVRRNASALVASSGEQKLPSQAGIQMQAAADAVDAMPLECLAHLGEIRRRKLLRKMKLVVVHQLAEPFNRCPHFLGRRDTRKLRLVAARIETRRHVAERPDTERCLHRRAPIVIESVSYTHLTLPTKRIV